MLAKLSDQWSRSLIQFSGPIVKPWRDIGYRTQAAARRQ